MLPICRRGKMKMGIDRARGTGGAANTRENKKNEVWVGLGVLTMPPIPAKRNF